MTFCILEYDDAMDEHIVPPVQKWSEWRLRLAHWLLGCDQDAARKRLRSAIARSGQPYPLDTGTGHAAYSWWTTPTGEDADAVEAATGKPAALIHAPTGIFAFSHGEAAPSEVRFNVTYTPFHADQDLQEEVKP